MKTIEKREPYLHTLNTRGNIYEEFLPDQVLTHKNLNKVVNYFEDQDRLGRVYLIGVGVGCGLNIVSYSNSYIEIGQGVGVTTDGDIIKSETRRFHYYSVLTDRASYELFDGLQVYEIYEQEGAGRPNGELPLSSFTSNESGALKDYILVAYVEDYTEDEGLCGGSGCDETGNKVYSNLKFLLVHKSNKSALVAEDTIYNSHDVLSYYDTLPELCMPRLLLTKDNTTSGISIHDQFTTSFSLKTDLYNGITTIIDRFSHRINFAKFGVTIPQITAYFDDIFVVQDEPYIQYKYDLLKDLIDTYREIRDLILFTRFECVANINAFPKHLLLGTLEEATRLQTRHEFYPSPTVSENDENLMAIRALCIKFFNQLKEYRIPNTSSAAIKITPSKNYEFKLSERSIPYYYETKNSLISNWNPLAIQLRKLKKHLGYHVANLQNIPCVQKPLEYSHLDKDFYRIEGHIGKDFRSALRKINSLKAKYNLAFDVKTVSIGFPVNKVSLEDDTCNTKDYSILLQTWEQEFCCVAESATEFFSKYQFDDLGNNDTSTSIYALATQDQQQVLQLLGRRSATGETTNPEKIEGRTINTNVDALEVDAGQRTESARYSQSLQYAIDEAYSYVGTQNVAGLYLATVALGIIDQAQGTVDRGSDYFFYTEAPIKIIAGLADIKRNFLKSLDEVYVTEKWTALNNAIDGLCTHVDQVLFAISEATDDATYGTKTHDKMYEFFIYELSKICCLKEKLAWLKAQIDEIRDNLYRELILSRLIEKHPGIEHMAGVPKGGTFLMVYLGGTEELLEDETRLSQFNGIVQFDFALPYMCCSDCPPETIVYNAEPDITLTISKTKYCLPTDEGQVDFIIGPADGIITSPQGDAFIVATDSGYAFDPTAVPDDLLGQPLTFLVNGTTPLVPLELCVFKLPTDITPSVEFLSWDETGINLDLLLSHDLDTQTYYSYIWNRADGSEIAITKEVIAAFFANPGDTFQETFTVTISITGNPVPCTVTTDLELDFSRPVGNSVTVPPIICHRLIETTPAWTQIIITPSDATLTSPEDASPSFIEQNNDGNYFIDPAKVLNELAGNPITFAINGEIVDGVSTRVAKLPSTINTDIPTFDVIAWDETGVNINIRAEHTFQSENYIQYRWIDLNNDNTEIGTTRNLPNFRIENGGEATVTVNYRLVMSVIGLEDSCTETFNINFTINRPSLEIPRGICFGQSIELGVNAGDVVTTSLSNNVIENNDGIITFESGFVLDADIDQEIQIFINGSPVGITRVYKLPTDGNIDRGYQLDRWDGGDLIIDLGHDIRIPNIANPENYLEAKWFDENGNPIATTTNHRILAGGNDVNLTYTIVICVQSSLMDADPCETIPINVTISEDAPTPDLPTDLGLLDRYCWKEGDPAFSIPIAVSPTDFVITSPQVGTSILRQNAASHTFRASAISNTLAGELIEFRIGTTPIDSTTVYKLPAENTIAHDRSNSQFQNGSYEFRFSHTFDDKDYFEYEVIEIQTGQQIGQVAPGVFKISADNSVNVRCSVRISIPNLCTTEVVTVTVSDIRLTEPTEPTEPTNPTTGFRTLNCGTPYVDRLNELGVNTGIQDLENKFFSEPFSNAITGNVINPMRNVVKQIQESTDVNNDSIGAISQINGLRQELNNKYLRSSGFTGDKKSILELDELLEIMSLELLRCVDENNAELRTIYNEMINVSNTREADYGDNSRSKITQEYLDSFDTKDDTFKTTISNTFVKGGSVR
ncbi:hypothetical protein [uncultured Kordia sp.]|uniref:hypothetical protein n=1 Tax=uncultured Kordia sp. TaxID=507699 RepID=UPI002612A958|nr:hypothetical protein [uncultured Kordia sp.]